MKSEFWLRSLLGIGLTLTGGVRATCTSESTITMPDSLMPKSIDVGGQTPGYSTLTPTSGTYYGYGLLSTFFGQGTGIIELDEKLALVQVNISTPGEPPSGWQVNYLTQGVEGRRILAASQPATDGIGFVSILAEIDANGIVRTDLLTSTLGDFTFKFYDSTTKLPVNHGMAVTSRHKAQYFPPDSTCVSYIDKDGNRQHTTLGPMLAEVPRTGTAGKVHTDLMAQGGKNLVLKAKSDKKPIIVLVCGDKDIIVPGILKNDSTPGIFTYVDRLEYSPGKGIVVADIKPKLPVLTVGGMVILPTKTDTMLLNIPPLSAIICYENDNGAFKRVESKNVLDISLREQPAPVIIDEPEPSEDIEPTPPGDDELPPPPPAPSEESPPTECPECVCPPCVCPECVCPECIYPPPPPARECPECVCPDCIAYAKSNPDRDACMAQFSDEILTAEACQTKFGVAATPEACQQYMTVDGCRAAFGDELLTQGACESKYRNEIVTQGACSSRFPTICKSCPAGQQPICPGEVEHPCAFIPLNITNYGAAGEVASFADDGKIFVVDMSKVDWGGTVTIMPKLNSTYWLMERQIDGRFLRWSGKPEENVQEIEGELTLKKETATVTITDKQTGATYTEYPCGGGAGFCLVYLGCEAGGSYAPCMEVIDTECRKK